MENQSPQIKKQKERKIAQNIYTLIVVIVLVSALFFISIGKSINDKNINPEKTQKINSDSTSQ